MMTQFIACCVHTHILKQPIEDNPTQKTIKKVAFFKVSFNLIGRLNEELTESGGSLMFDRDSVQSPTGSSALMRFQSCGSVQSST